ncbi:MAG: hypothetical protein IJN67_13985 [Oscillospiraceae bacterium]|nr:hypothetical protein [Oscillospiraceae bacterium]
MELITSQLPAKAYCAYLKQKLDSPFYFWDERMNGIVIGPFFSLAHHAEWEWNRKITGEINRAWGFVQEKDGVTEVRFLRGKGLLAPSWMLFITVLGVAALYFNIGEMMEQFWPACLAIALAVGITTAIQASFTENGVAGAGEITRFLRDPKEYYC